MPDVTLENVVREVHQQGLADAFNGLAGKRIEMMAHGDGGNPENPNFNGNWSFTIAPKGESENLKQFGERFLRELGIAALRLWDYAEDQDRYRGEVALITPASQDVPDDAIEQL